MVNIKLYNKIRSKRKEERNLFCDGPPCKWKYSHWNCIKQNFKRHGYEVKSIDGRTLMFGWDCHELPIGGKLKKKIKGGKDKKNISVLDLEISRSSLKWICSKQFERLGVWVIGKITMPQCLMMRRLKLHSEILKFLKMEACIKATSLFFGQ